MTPSRYETELQFVNRAGPLLDRDVQKGMAQATGIYRAFQVKEKAKAHGEAVRKSCLGSMSALEAEAEGRAAEQNYIAEQGNIVRKAIEEHQNSLVFKAGRPDGSTSQRKDGTYRKIRGEWVKQRDGGRSGEYEKPYGSQARGPAPKEHPQQARLNSPARETAARELAQTGQGGKPRSRGTPPPRESSPHDKLRAEHAANEDESKKWDDHHKKTSTYPNSTPQHRAKQLKDLAQAGPEGLNKKELGGIKKLAEENGIKPEHGAGFYNGFTGSKEKGRALHKLIHPELHANTPEAADKRHKNAAKDVAELGSGATPERIKEYALDHGADPDRLMGHHAGNGGKKEENPRAKAMLGPLSDKQRAKNKASAASQLEKYKTLHKSLDPDIEAFNRMVAKGGPGSGPHPNHGKKISEGGKEFHNVDGDWHEGHRRADPATQHSLNQKLKGNPFYDFGSDHGPNTKGYEKA